MSNEMNPVFDVVAVNLKTKKVRMIAECKTGANAEAIETMAVIRRGVEEEFFSVISHGEYKDGDKWRGRAV